MKNALHAFIALAALGVLASGSTASGQEDNGTEYRKLAPGVMTTIEAEPLAEETVSTHDIVEILALDPEFQTAKNVSFRRDVWALEFSFKPVRMVWVDVPQPGDKMRRQLVWYMIYKVTNTGAILHPVEKNETPQKFDVERVSRPLRFIPQFLLEDPESEKVYSDRLVPVAMQPIRRREDPNRRLLTTVEMSQQQIAPGESVWGVVTWLGVDPRIDRFSVYVIGLTNAYRWHDEPGAYKPGDPLGTGRQLRWKTLKLNFWRPGDEYYQHEDEIRFGQPGGVDWEWVYR